MHPDDSGAVVLIATVVWLVVGIGLYVWTALALSKLFARLDTDSWRAWVPVLNQATILQLGGQAPWLVLLAGVPIANLYVVWVYIVAVHRINAILGKGAGMTVLATLIPPLWATLMASPQFAPAPGRDLMSAQEPSFTSDPAPFRHELADQEVTQEPLPDALAGDPFRTPPPYALARQEPDELQGLQVPSFLSGPAGTLPPPPPPPEPTYGLAAPQPTYGLPEHAQAPVPPAVAEQVQAQVADAVLPPPPPPPPAPPAPAPAAQPVAADDAAPAIVVHNPWAPAPTEATAPPAVPLPEITAPPAFLPPPPPPPVASAPADAPAAAPVVATSPFLTPAAPAIGTAPDAHAASVEEDDDDGETIVVDRRPRITWFLEIEGGDQLPLTHAVVLLGRKPAATDASVQALAVPDTTRTLSKVHARLERHDDEWTITDLNSTNGVMLVATDGTETLLSPGVSVPVSGRFVLGEVAMSIGFSS